VKLNDDVYPTDMQWFPKAGASKKGSASDVFALSSTDGSYILLLLFVSFYYIVYAFNTVCFTTGRYSSKYYLLIHYRTVCRL